jgi:hypothetical protein
LGRNYDDKRVPIKLQVNFGDHCLDNIGFTDDISANGIFIKTAVVFSSNTELGIELILPDENVVRIKGLVNWSKGVAPNLVWATKDAGIGIRILKFISGQDDYYRLVVSRGET